MEAHEITQTLKSGQEAGNRERERLVSEYGPAGNDIQEASAELIRDLIPKVYAIVKKHVPKHDFDNLLVAAAESALRQVQDYKKFSEELDAKRG